MPALLVQNRSTDQEGSIETAEKEPLSSYKDAWSMYGFN
jgi:molybdenum-dependent DNA-binding transcriptional regulator ModE